MSIIELKEYCRNIIQEKLKQFKKYEMKIDLSDYNYIQITVKDEKGDEEIIQLNDNENKTKLSIEFNKDEIIIGKDGINSINNFFKDLYQNPEEEKKYNIKYDKKLYQINAEIIMGIILQKYKQIIEKKGKIETIEIKTIKENYNEIFKERINKLLFYGDISFQNSNDYYDNNYELVKKLLRKDNEIIYDILFLIRASRGPFRLKPKTQGPSHIHIP